MTIATLGCKPKLVTVLDDKQLAAINGRVFLARIMGTARGLKLATDTSGNPVFGLTGQFLAMVRDTGGGPDKEFQSGVLYLPGGLQEMVQSPLEAGIDGGDKATAISFALDLFAVKAPNKAGYSFAADLKGDAAQADPFAAMRARFEGEAAKLPALPNLAPAQTAEAAAAQAAQSQKSAEEAAAKEAAKTKA